MPARKLPSKRRVIRLAKKQKSRKGKGSYFLFKLLLVLLIPVTFFLILILTTKYWDGVHKLVIASDTSEGVDLTIYDPSSGSITDVIIPGSTEVEVARNLGTWRLKAVTKLAEKEKDGDRLLTDTITKHFRFPIYNAKLGLGDRIRIYYYNLTVKNYKRESINLNETKYLKKTTLNDGEEGYVVSGKIPANIAALFSEPALSASLIRTKIVDKSGASVGERVGEIVEVLGLKVISVNEEIETDTDCTVSGKNREALAAIEKIFGCTEDPDDSDFDVLIVLGKRFSRRF